MKIVVEAGIKKYFQMRKFKYQIWKKNALDTQEFILFDLLNTAKYTKFGKEFNFEEISDYEDFKKNVPISNYEEIYPYIQKMLDGEHDILWPGFTSFFSRSSGTTNDVSKYIPVSHDALYKNIYVAGKDIYTIFFDNYPDSDIFKNNGSVLSLGGSLSPVNEKGIRVGDVSAVMMSQLPKWAAKYRQPTLDIALMSEWKSKIPAILDDVKGKNITHILGVPTWFISLFEEAKKQNKTNTLQDIFPNIELFFHGAVAFEPYRQIFENLFPQKNMKYMEAYNASEGFFAIQDDPEKNGEMLLLTDHGIFYEFIKMDEYGMKNQTTINLSNISIGVDYAMIISTNAGLWRYDIGDTIQFTSVDPYRIKISGRTKHFINVFGEELMVGNTDAALSFVCKKHNVQIENYTAGPIFMNKQGKGGHEWIIEFKNDPQNLGDFIIDLDSELQNVNSDYKAKRQDDIALQCLKLHAVPAKTFMKWMEGRGKLGAQNKVPRLSNRRRFIEEILNIL
ncbi:MAG: GH3 auxin-responsive promoter family protein [Candidatus Pacebacteria bacterium]|nr:GH3 auxin-responsive promoter family protein [Candidatus Paceibacterota bacterium]